MEYMVHFCGIGTWLNRKGSFLLDFISQGAIISFLECVLHLLSICGQEGVYMYMYVCVYLRVISFSQYHCLVLSSGLIPAVLPYKYS